MEQLSRTAGFLVAETVVQRVDSPGFASYLGTGKIQRIKNLVIDTGASAVITRHNLKPSQMLTLERALGVEIVDRTQLILQIFSDHAKTREGKLEVELAQLKYELPKLTGMGHSLSQTAGGIGTRGPGEQLLEKDRRKLSRRIRFLEKQLKLLRKDRELTRKKRMLSDIPVVSFVGYTNAGKSTIVSALSSCELIVEDKLFSTLDTRTKRVKLHTGQTVLATDTVGFIKDLPHYLMQSFRSTLEEAAFADLIVKVVDASDSFVRNKLRTVDETLKEIGANSVPSIVALNKIDRCANSWLEELERAFPGAVLISAQKLYNLEELEKAIDDFLRKEFVEETIEINQDSVPTFMRFRNHLTVIKEEYLGEKVKIRYSASEKTHKKLVSSLKEVGS